MLKNIHEIFRPVNYYVYKGIKYIEETKLISEFFERHDITDEMIANINDMVVIFLYLVVAISVIANIIKNILKKVVSNQEIKTTKYIIRTQWRLIQNRWKLWWNKNQKNKMDYQQLQNVIVGFLHSKYCKIYIMQFLYMNSLM